MKIKDTSWRIRNWQIPHLDGLELIHASNVTHDYPRHIHGVLHQIEDAAQLINCRVSTVLANCRTLLL